MTYIYPVCTVRETETVGGLFKSDVAREGVKIVAGHDGTVSHCVLAAAGPQVSPHLPVGLAGSDDASRWTIRDVRCSGFGMVPVAGKYTNGDGFSTERENIGWTFEDCTAADCADGGFDLKGPETVLRRVTGIGNTRNFRFWDSATVEDWIASHSPVHHGGSNGRSHIWLSARRDTYTTLTIDGTLVIHSEDSAVPLFTGEGEGWNRVLIRDYLIVAPPGQVLMRGKVSVNWGAQGVPDFAHVQPGAA